MFGIGLVGCAKTPCLGSLREGREERRIVGGREVASGLDPEDF